jgi:hypothetical protein
LRDSCGAGDGRITHWGGVGQGARRAKLVDAFRLTRADAAHSAARRAARGALELQSRPISNTAWH